jgi:hypothetical protein
MKKNNLGRSQPLLEFKLEKEAWPSNAASSSLVTNQWKTKSTLVAYFKPDERS